MNNQPPFRKPCVASGGGGGGGAGGDAPPKRYRCCHGHDTGSVIADRYVNITVVPNPLGGDDIAPNERFTPDPSGGDSCETHGCDPDGQPCSQWILPYTDNTFSLDGTVDFSVARKHGFKNAQARRYWNGRFGYRNIESSNSPDNVEGCGDFTQVSWRSYISAIDQTKYLTLDISCDWEQTIYDYSTGSPVTSTTTESLALTQSINEQSGIITFSGLTVSPNDERNHALSSYGPALWTFGEIVSRMTVETIPTPPGGDKICSGSSITITDHFGRTVEQVDWDIGAGTFTRSVYQWSSTPTQLTGFSESVTLSDTGITYTSTENDYNTPTISGVGDPDGINQSITITVTGTLSDANLGSDVYDDQKNLLEEIPLDDDILYPWRTDLKVSVAPLVSRDELAGTAFTTNWFVKDYSAPITDTLGFTLGDPGWLDRTGITLAQAPMTGGSVVTMGGTASNGDDFTGTFAANPFSHCLPTGFSMAGTLPPGVSFDSSTGELSGTCSADCSWGITVTVTGAAPAATGDVLGALKPAGYINFFDFGYRDWLGCCFRPPDDPGFQTWSWYQFGWGMAVGTFNSNTGCLLPMNATQWTNYFQAVNKPQGAWIFYNDPVQTYYGIGCVSSDAGSGVLDGGALWAGKYAEILETWNSQNFARPAAADKYAFDENHVFCAVNLSGAGAGSTWTITDPLTGIAPADATDFSGAWAGPVVDGFYAVDDYSSGTLTLGAKLYDLPSDWTSKSNSDEAACFGKLRWPATTPALLGRAAITPDLPGTTFAYAEAQPSFGMDTTTHQEQVDIYDSTMTLLSSNKTATRVDDSTFTVVLGDAQPTAAFVMIHGAAAWYMNDTEPKGDYAVLEWLGDARSPGEYNRLLTAVDCAGTPITQPTENAGGGPVANPFENFTQTPGCLPFSGCNPRVVCISPNGETFPNGITYPFPEDFVLDEQYGSKWWGWVEATMTDLFWQHPHRPCNLKPCGKWTMDGGICADNIEGSCPGDGDYVPDESTPPEYFFAYAPQVEARLTIPGIYGDDSDESAPALPSGVQIGWLSPVDYDTGDVAFPPHAPTIESDRGNPGGASTSWNLHELFCDHTDGCRFDYAVPGC